MEIAAHYLSLLDVYDSNDQWRFFNMMEWDHREKGKGKGQFLGISYFWIEVLGLLPYEGTTFIPNLSS